MNILLTLVMPVRIIAHLAMIPSFGVWRSLVAHLLWEQGVGGSNPSAPTKSSFNCLLLAKIQQETMVFDFFLCGSNVYEINCFRSACSSSG